jgi:hypothetical protein
MTTATIIVGTWLIISALLLAGALVSYLVALWRARPVRAKTTNCESLMLGGRDDANR